MEVTTALLARIERAEVECFEASVVAMQKDPPNSIFRSFGGGRGFVTTGVAHGMYNRVLCLGAGDVAHVPDIVTFYEEHGVPPRIDLVGRRSSEQLTQALRDHGFVRDDGPSLDCRMLVADTTAPGAPLQAHIQIQKLTRDHLDDWVAIDRAVWPFERGDLMAKLLATYETPGLFRYLAYIDGEPVALGRLHVHGGIGQLNGAGTLEAYRGRGCQAALIRHRIIEAARLGCDAVASLVAVDGQSDKNLQRGGLVVGCDREVWRPADWRAHPFFR